MRSWQRSDERPKMQFNCLAYLHLQQADQATGRPARVHLAVPRSRWLRQQAALSRPLRLPASGGLLRPAPVVRRPSTGKRLQRRPKQETEMSAHLPALQDISVDPHRPSRGMYHRFLSAWLRPQWQSHQRLLLQGCRASVAMRAVGGRRPAHQHALCCRGFARWIRPQGGTLRMLCATWTAPSGPHSPTLRASRACRAHRACRRGTLAFSSYSSQGFSCGAALQLILPHPRPFLVPEACLALLWFTASRTATLRRSCRGFSHHRRLPSCPGARCSVCRRRCRRRTSSCEPASSRWQKPRGLMTGGNRSWP